MTQSNTVQLASVRLIAADFPKLVRFYEVLTGTAARYVTDDFAELVTPSATVAVSSADRVAFIADDTPRGGANNTVFIEFLVEDADALYAALLAEFGDELVVLQEPTTMPWGNRSVLLRDPEGSPVNLYTPVTPAGIELQQGRTPAILPART